MKTTYKILLVADKQIDAEPVTKEFRENELNFEQKIVDNKKDFLEALDQFLPDVILFSHNLSSYSSSDALKLLKAKILRVPLIVINIGPTEEPGLSALRDGAEDYLLKDHLKRLPFAVANAVTKYRLEKEQKRLQEEIERLNTKDSAASKETYEGIISNGLETKKAELQLRERSEGLASISKATFDAFWDWDLITDELYFGEGYQTIFGYNLAETRSDIKEWTEHIHPQDCERILKEVRALRDSNQTNWLTDYRYLKADNTYACVIDKFIVIRDVSGKAIRMIGAMQDITEKTALEKKIQFERNRMHELFLHAPTMIGVVKGPDYIFEMANEFFRKVITKRDVIGERLVDVLPGALSQGFIKILDTVYATGETFSASEILFQLNNQQSGKIEDVYLNLSYQPYRDVAGNIEGVFFFALDVTEQVLSRKKIESSEARYRQMVETAQEGIWLIDANNRTTFVNNRMCEILGYSCEEMMGREIYDFMDDMGRKVAIELMKKKRQGHIGRDRFKYISKTGKDVWTHVSANPIFNDDGSYKGALAMIIDITLAMKQEQEILKNSEERELLLAELTRTNRDLKQFTFITSHNFRAPLSNLIALLGMVDYDTLSENNLEIIEMFKKSTQQLNKTINDLSQILLIKNTIDVNIADIDLQVLLNEISNSLAYEISEYNCTIEFDLQVKNIQFNKSYFESILINLISNAIKYRSPHRPLHIKVTSALNEKGEVTLRVQDNGSGIDVKRHKENLFGLYQKFHSNGQGSGLGLYIVKSQVTSLGGSIEVESEVDKGTTFIITLKKKGTTVKETATLDND